MCQHSSEYCAWSIYLDISALTSLPGKDSDVEWGFRAPLPMLAALLHPLDVTDLGNDGKHDLRVIMSRDLLIKPSLIFDKHSPSSP